MEMNKNKEELLNLKSTLQACQTASDHLWKQVGEPKQNGHYIYGDMYGHPEDRPAIWINETLVTFKCEKCGAEKVLKM